MDTKSTSGLVIKEANRWFIKRILKKNGFRSNVEPHFTKILMEEVPFKNLKNEGIKIPECSPKNYIAIKTEFHFVPFVSHRQIWSGGPDVDIFVSGIIILPREFFPKIRPIYSTKMFLENYPEIHNFPMFSFPVRGITHLQGDIFKDLKEDSDLFRLFLRGLRKKLLKKQEVLHFT